MTKVDRWLEKMQKRYALLAKDNLDEAPYIRTISTNYFSIRIRRLPQHLMFTLTPSVGDLLKIVRVLVPETAALKFSSDAIADEQADNCHAALNIAFASEKSTKYMLQILEISEDEVRDFTCFDWRKLQHRLAMTVAEDFCAKLQQALEDLLSLKMT